MELHAAESKHRLYNRPADSVELVLQPLTEAARESGSQETAEVAPQSLQETDSLEMPNYFPPIEHCRRHLRCLGRHCSTTSVCGPKLRTEMPTKICRKPARGFLARLLSNILGCSGGCAQGSKHKTQTSGRFNVSLGESCEFQHKSWGDCELNRPGDPRVKEKVLHSYSD